MGFPDEKFANAFEYSFIEHINQRFVSPEDCLVAEFSNSIDGVVEKQNYARSMILWGLVGLNANAL